VLQTVVICYAGQGLRIQWPYGLAGVYERISTLSCVSGASTTSNRAVDDAGSFVSDALRRSMWRRKTSYRPDALGLDNAVDDDP